MLKKFRADFIFGQELDSCYKICDLYTDCFACSNLANNICLISCDTVQQGNSPWYSCMPDTSDTSVVFIASQLKNENFIIYPNPFNDQFKIFFSGEKPGYELVLLNMYGKEVSRLNVKSSSFVVKLDGLQDGIYFMRIRVDKAIYFRKMLKLSP